ncbi:MAG: metal-dependent hydrolase [Deltaproteobacteria bacterium]|nr:metal-dependent hydrolase [Deltaproteobacteria bacterium]
MSTRSSRSTAAARAASPLPIVRRLDLVFDASSVPRDWYGHDTHLSTFFNGLSLLFPEGEKFFVQSVRHFANRLDDGELKRRVAAFIGQEALHSAEHRSFNEMLRDQGDELVVRLEREVRWLLILGHRVLTPKAQLAVTCALEHYTAILAEQLLSLPEHQAAIDDALRPLWLWHALEESEHKAVAFDVFTAVGGSYTTRAAMMLLATVFFVAEVANVHTRLLLARGRLLDARGSSTMVGFLWGRDGLFRKLVGLLDYFRPSFHPDDRDTTELVERWAAHFSGWDKNARRGRGSRPARRVRAARTPGVALPASA